MSIMSGAEMVIKSLEAENVKTVFGIPGGAVIPLYDAMYDSNLNHILMRHEQAAAHAADGFARVSGKPGVCIATSGPGATNLVTGIATAQIDSVPMVAITGQVATGIIGTDGFQEADILGITLPIVKHSMQVRSADQIAPTMKKAFHIASTGRPGVVLVDVPGDIQKQSGDFSYPEKLEPLPGYKPDPIVDISGLDNALELIESAKRPVIFAGGGVIRSGASKQLKEFAEKLQIPVITSLMGKGAFPESHRLSLGMAGMHGHPAANRALIVTDLIISVGSRFSDRTTGKVARFATEAKIIHIDLDPAEINKTVGSDVWLAGDAACVMDELSKPLKAPSQGREEWLAETDKMREAEPMPRKEIPGAIAPWQIVETLCELSGGKGVVTTEVGQNQMWAAQYYKAEGPRRFLTSGGLGTMGYGFPAAIGAAVAGSDGPVSCIAGDGSFIMNVQELDTCARFNIPVKVFILNNSCLGMVRQWQQLFYNERYSNTIYNCDPDYAAIAEAMGVRGFTESKPENVRKVIEAALETPGPALVDFKIPQDALVLPMIPAGGALDEMILG